MKLLLWARMRSCLLLAILCLALLPDSANARLVSQGDNPNRDPDILYDQGLDLFVQGQYEIALPILKDALQLYKTADNQPGEAVCLTLIGVASYRLSNFIDAVDALESALSIWQEIDNLNGEGTALMGLGAIYEDLNQNDSALRYYKEALLAWQQLGRPQKEADVSHTIGLIYYALDDYIQALVYFQQALDIQQKIIDDQFGAARTLNNMGLAYNSLASYEDALEHYSQARSILHSYGHRFGEATALYGMGVVNTAQGKYAEALKHYEQALPLWQEVEGREGLEGLADTIGNIGEVYRLLAKYEQSLYYATQTLSLREQIGDPMRIARAQNNLGAVNYILSRYGQALEYYTQASTILHEQKDRYGEAGAHINTGVVYYAWAKYDQAREHYKQAANRYTKALEEYDQAFMILQEAHLPDAEKRIVAAAILNNRGVIYRSLGDYQGALSAYQEVLPILQETGNPYEIAAVLNNIGLIYSFLSEYDQAYNYFQQALSIREEITDLGGQANTLHNLGGLYERQGKRSQAISNYKLSIEKIESIQGDIKVEELKTSFISDQIDTYKSLINLLSQEQDSDEAFNYIERAQARAFLDQIGNQPINVREGGDSALIQEEQTLRQQIVSIQDALADERSKPFPEQNRQRLDSLSQDLKTARQRYQELLIRLKVDNPEYASLISVNTLTLAEVQKVLDKGVTLVEYFILDDFALALVVDHNDFEMVPLNVEEATLTEKTRHLLKLIQNQKGNQKVSTERAEKTEKIATELYDILFAPLVPHIRYPTNLILVPHGVLHYLPFAALWNAQDARYLIEDYSITYAPGASVLSFIQDKRNVNEGRLLAMGNPDGSLRYAEIEVTVIADLYGATPLLQNQASETQFRNLSPQTDLLLLAAHGIYDPFNPLFTRIELAAENGNNGYLEVHEVYGLDLRAANLVVLSACESGLGELSLGNEIVGLTRAFLYAGTPSVVTTLWTIDDEASGALMLAFYNHLRAGLSTAEALRQAQREQIEQDNRRFPYYWAAFTLSGDYLGWRE